MTNCFICCWKPRSISPMVLLTGTRASSKTSSAVSEERLPSLSSVRETRTPGVAVSTTICDIPWWPPASQVRASKHSQSACVPLVMYILLPLMTHSSPSRTARVRIEATSEPAPASVTAIEQTAVPAMAGAR